MTNNLRNIDTFILCGGRGRRLREVSAGIPKPMVKINNRPFVDLIIAYLAGFGFCRFILGTGYKAKVIEDYYRKNRKPGLEIRFSYEFRPLDTGGAIKNAQKEIKSNPFMVLNGDSFAKFNPESFLNFHRKNKSIVSILLKKVFCGKEYGKIKLDKSARILSFSEKNIRAKNCLINGGVYLFDRNVFKLMPSASKFSLEKKFFPEMAGKGIFGYLSGGFFIDIGTPERFAKARRYLKDG